MTVYYKFNFNLNSDKVTFDGLHISVGELKKAIMQQKKIGKSNDFDLQITNSQTKEVYTSDDDLIQKNTTVIVARVPVTTKKKQWKEQEQSVTNNHEALISFDKIITSSDFSKLETEEEKLRTIMTQSTQDYDSSNFVKTRPMTGPVPANYRCKRCGIGGHFVKHCPTNNQTDVKRSTGIPRSFMMPAKADQRGALITSTGEYVVPIIDHEAYKERKKERPPFVPNENPELDEKLIEQIPEDLQCSLCKSLLQDAVMIPCCVISFCDECVRTHLLDSEQHQCPSCNETGVSPDKLVPNRYLRTKVIKYKNENSHFSQPYQPYAGQQSIESLKVASNQDTSNKSLLNSKSSIAHVESGKDAQVEVLKSKAGNEQTVKNEFKKNTESSPQSSPELATNDEQSEKATSSAESPKNLMNSPSTPDDSKNEVPKEDRVTGEEVVQAEVDQKDENQISSDVASRPNDDAGSKNSVKESQSNDDSSKSNQQNGSNNNLVKYDRHGNLRQTHQSKSGNINQQPLPSRHTILGHPPHNQVHGQPHGQRMHSSTAINNNPPAHLYPNNNYPQRPPRHMHNKHGNQQPQYPHGNQHLGYNQMPPNQMMNRQQQYGQHGSNYYDPMYSNYNGQMNNLMQNNYGQYDQYNSPMQQGYTNYMDQNADPMYNRFGIDTATMTLDQQMEVFTRKLEEKNFDPNMINSNLSEDYHRRRQSRSKSRQYRSRSHHRSRSSSDSRSRTRSSRSSSSRRSISRSHSRSRSRSIHYNSNRKYSSKNRRTRDYHGGSRRSPSKHSKDYYASSSSNYHHSSAHTRHSRSPLHNVGYAIIQHNPNSSERYLDPKLGHRLLSTHHDKHSSRSVEREHRDYKEHRDHKDYNKEHKDHRDHKEYRDHHKDAREHKDQKEHRSSKRGEVRSDHVKPKSSTDRIGRNSSLDKHSPSNHETSSRRSRKEETVTHHNNTDRHRDHKRKRSSSRKHRSSLEKKLKTDSNNDKKLADEKNNSEIVDGKEEKLTKDDNVSSQRAKSKSSDHKSETVKELPHLDSDGSSSICSKKSSASCNPNSSDIQSDPKRQDSTKPEIVSSEDQLTRIRCKSIAVDKEPEGESIYNLMEFNAENDSFENEDEQLPIKETIKFANNKEITKEESEESDSDSDEGLVDDEEDNVSTKSDKLKEPKIKSLDTSPDQKSGKLVTSKEEEERRKHRKRKEHRDDKEDKDRKKDKKSKSKSSKRDKDDRTKSSKDRKRKLEIEDSSSKKKHKKERKSKKEKDKKSSTKSKDKKSSRKSRDRELEKSCKRK